MIEIDLSEIQKGLKRIYVKPTSQRKGHYRQIEGASGESEAFKDIKKYPNAFEFMRSNVKELKSHGVSDMEGTKRIFNKLRLERFTFTDMSKKNAISEIIDGIRDSVHTGWFRYEDKGMKPKLLDAILNEDKVRSAGLRIMYDTFKIINDSSISFDEFLQKDITLYRGGSITNDVFTSFSLDKGMAEKFANQNKTEVIEVTMKPIHTLGSYQTIAEAEVLVPKEVLDK